jgi:hypothetical protein
VRRHGVRYGLRKKYAVPEELLREDGAAAFFEDLMIPKFA